MNTKKRNNWLIKLGLSLLVLIVIYTLTFLVNPYSLYWTTSCSISIVSFSIEFLICFLFSMGMIEGSILIAKVLEPRIPWAVFPIRRFMLQTILIVLLVMVLIYIQCLFFDLLYGETEITKEDMLAGWQFLVVSIITALFVSAVHTGYYLLTKWKDSVTETIESQIKTLEFKEIAMNAELESLKAQLNPHFMFNNFSVLSELINEDTATASKFLDNLSRVYRYMIQNIKKNIIPLKDEISFVKAYFYLLEIRHGNNVRLNIELTENSLKSNIPPITLQLLVENAIKHNVATKEQPLLIEIVSIDDKYLQITNNLQRISTPFPSIGIGLKNIENRYRILSENKLPSITETDTHFSVILPLLNSKDSEHENLDN